MKTYFFNVFLGDNCHSYQISANTLSQALNLLESEITKYCFYLRDLLDWTVCKSYTIYSASGKRSRRSLSTIIRGVA